MSILRMASVLYITIFELLYLAIPKSMIDPLTILGVILLILASFSNVVSNLYPRNYDPADNSFSGKKSFLRLTIALLLVTIFAIGTLVGIYRLGLVQTALGLRIYITPILLALIISKIERKMLTKILNIIGVLITANAIVSILQWRLGIGVLDFFSNASTETNFRFMGGGKLRSPGMTRSNVSLGLWSAIYLIFTGSAIFKNVNISKFQIKIFQLSAVISVLLSTSRTAMLLLIIFYLVLFFRKNAGESLRMLLISFVIIVSVVKYFSFLFSTSSLQPRREILGYWLKSLSLFGDGIGSVGSATFSKFSTKNMLESPLGTFVGRFVDNSPVSLLVQFGYLAGTLLFAIITWYIFKKDNFSPEFFFIRRTFLIALVISSFLAEIADYGISLVTFFIIERLDISQRRGNA